MFEERAQTYRALNDLSRERDDLLKAIQLNIKDSSAYPPAPYPRAAILEVRLGNVPGAIQLYRQYATRRSPFLHQPEYAMDAAYHLLLLGESKESAHLLDTVEEGSTKQLLRALIYRVQGDRYQAFCAFGQVDCQKSIAVFADSRLTVRQPMSIVRRSCTLMTKMLRERESF